MARKRPIITPVQVPTPAERTERPILFKASPEEHQTIRTAAGIAGVPMNQLCLEASLERARQVIAEFTSKG